MSRDTAHMCIAVVEDEPHMASLLSDMLASADIDVEVFHLAADFLKSTGLCEFRTVILDLSLPDIDGFDLMERIATMGLACSVVLISGHAPAALKAARLYGTALGLDVRAAFCKPFSRDELLMTIELPA